MGRPERRINVELKPAGEFANQLRQLRAEAGAPTYRLMAARSHYAATTLSRAAAGRTLPSLSVVLAYVAACGGDSAEWRRRWEDTCAALEHDQSSGHPTDDRPADTPGLAHRPAIKRRSLVITLGVAGIALVAGIMLIATLPPAHTAPPGGLPLSSSPAPLIASDGDNPQVDGCASPATARAIALGAKEIEGLPVKSPGGRIIGYLGLWRNARCGAEWAEASYLNPHLYLVTLESYRPADRATVIDQQIVNLPRDPVIGKLLTTGRGCVRAQLVLHIPKSKPITVRTPCA